ncbi:hypothetical protein [Timonella sp. A28]|uniref:hypothetical protein n=1 Tax=Timonella sp. A28 TaxID=3442640 RepID=UPI003EB93B1E
MSQPPENYNPYTDNGPRSSLSKLVTGLAVILTFVLVGYYAYIGYNNERDTCLYQAEITPDVHVEFSLTWKPPFYSCTITGPVEQA